ncbi:MAG TPA: MFS transporter, partial [Thermomicrobiales bacterium]|nr:MFS transporter [Thermomicrobiales bacterium]
MPFALQLPRTLPYYVALALLFASSGTMWGIWIARIPSVANKLDMGTAQLGAVLPAFSAGALVAFPVTAGLTSRCGSRTIIRAAGVMRGLLFPALALAPNTFWLMVALALAGFTHGALDIALNAQGVEIERRTVGSILSRAHGSFSLGALVGSVSIGFAATAGLPLEWQFIIPGVPAVLMFSTVSTLLIPDDTTPTPTTQRLAAKRKWRGAGMLPRALWTIGAIALITGIADEAIADWAALLIQRELEATPLVASLAYSVYSLALLVGRFSGDGISERLPSMRILQIAGVMGAVGMIGSAALNSPYAMIGGIAVIGLGFSV